MHLSHTLQVLKGAPSGEKSRLSTALPSETGILKAILPPRNKQQTTVSITVQYVLNIGRLLNYLLKIIYNIVPIVLWMICHKLLSSE